MHDITCTKCGGHLFVRYCKHCDPSIEEIKSTARAEALREAADRAVDFCSSWNINSDWLRSAIIADKQEEK